MTFMPAQVDLRAFRWHLEPLQRKLLMKVDSARMAYAALRLEAQELQHALEDLTDKRRAELREARSGAGRLDPAMHMRGLRSLTRLSVVIEEKNAAVAVLQRRIDSAARACVDAEQQLARLEHVRDVAQEAFAVAQLRRAEKEADAAWLAARAQTGRASEWSSGSVA